jgi:hypothetical protein
VAKIRPKQVTDLTDIIKSMLHNQKPIAYIGYQTQTILVDKNNKMNINLQPESGSLEEVVVTASGINKEKNHRLCYSKMGKQLDTEL